jgi:N-methylhydantoinase B/oxoprolinase/acetone carboxylase alpha subunit
VLIRAGKSKRLPGKVRLSVQPGDRLRIETPGGGGWGRRSTK